MSVNYMLYGEQLWWYAMVCWEAGEEDSFWQTLMLLEMFRIGAEA